MDTYRKEMSEHLIDAMSKEDLHTRETGKYLNINPCYVSMARNPKSWDSMAKPAWARIEAWHQDRGKISDFVIPAGEEIWQPKESNSADNKPAEPSFLKKGKAVKKFAEKLKLVKEDIDRNLVNDSFDFRKTMYDPSPDISVKKGDVTHIPIALDLVINIEVCLKTRV